MTQIRAVIDGRAVQAAVQKTSDEQRVEASVDDRSYVLKTMSLRPGVYWVEINGQSLEVFVAAAQQGYTVSIGANRYHVEIEDSRSALRRTSRGGHQGTAEIKAPMPGKIVRLLVSEGAKIEAHQGILIMEAMKMQNEIKSPKDGVVKKIYCDAGTAVVAGDPLAIVE
jgi:biotin carboxyl carrier protein